MIETQEGAAPQAPPIIVSATTGYAVGQTNAGGLLIIKTTNGARTWTRVR